MTHLNSHLRVSLLVVLFVVPALTETEASRALVQTQETEKALDIERYPDEPLQLVSLKIGTQSVKNHIRPKFKDNVSKWGVDSVSFNEKDDWFKRISITMRNVSDKPIYGLHAQLFFRPAGFPMIFSMGLRNSKELGRDPLQPGAEIELVVNQALLNRTLQDMKHRGATLGPPVVSFSLDTVFFSDALQWHRGKLLRRDPAVPGKWIPAGDPVAAQRNTPRFAAGISYSGG